MADKKWKTEVGKQGEREEGRKGGREKENGGWNSMLRGEKLCADHDCGFARGGRFVFGLLSFAFV